MAPLAGSVLVERLTGVAVLAVISGICLLLQPAEPWDLHLALWLLVGVITVAIVLALAAGGRLLRSSGGLLTRLPAPARRITAKLSRFGEAVAGFRNAPRELVIACLWSCQFYGLLVLFQLAVLRAVGSDITLVDAALVAPLVPLVSLLPVTANGLGLSEGAFVLFYTQMGVPAEQAFAAAILRRLVTIAVSLPGGVIWLRSGRVGAVAESAP
jgi:uncharacterized protein (TIRG00374 family)